MKKPSLIISLLIALALLSACATVITATPTTIAEMTPTLKPTSIPPTATIEPSPTVDPNMPEGATGKDLNGNWIKTENGVTVAWNAELNTWERHLMVNDEGVPSLVYSEAAHQVAGYTDQLRLHVNVSDKVPGFEHLESFSLHRGAAEGNGPSFENIFHLHLQKRIGPTLTDDHQILRGEINLSFTTTEGSQNWKLGPDTTINVDILDKPVGNGFQDWIDPHGDHFQLKMFTDENGNLHLWVVPGRSIDQYTKEQLLEIYLFAPASVIDSSDHRVLGYSSELSTFVFAILFLTFLLLFLISVPRNKNTQHF